MSEGLSEALERLWAFGDKLTEGHEIDREAPDRMLERRPKPEDFSPRLRAALEAKNWFEMTNEEMRQACEEFVKAFAGTGPEIPPSMRSEVRGDCDE